MPTSDTVDIPAQTWTQITTADVTNISFDNVGGSDCWVKRSNTSAPSDITGAFRVRPGERGINEAIADVWPGLSGGRVWVFCYTAGRVAVQHA